MDCSVQKTRHEGMFLVSTTDFFFPLVEDPYVQGMIGCANVLSDMYAMGIADCDSLLMLLAWSVKMTPEQQKIVTSEMIRGFNDQAIAAGTKVTGGQTVRNPWPIIGGVAESVCKADEFITPENAVVGDVLVLTKAIGTQVAVNLKQWRSRQAPNWEKVKHLFETEDEAEEVYDKAMRSMSRLNRTGARLMHKYGAHGCTDVTGFGLLGHSKNLAKNQKADVSFEIHTLPVIKHAMKVNEIVNFRLNLGLSAETSGGLLIAMPEEKAAQFVKEIEEIDGCPAWVIGRVVPGTRDACILEDAKVLEV